MKTKILFTMIGIMIMISSCSYRLIDFTLISSKNTPGLKLDKNKGRQTSGKSIAFLGMGASIKDALDDALKNAGPEYDLLIDGVIRMKSYPFVSGYAVEGLAMNSSKLMGFLGNTEFEEWCSKNNVYIKYQQ